VRPLTTVAVLIVAALAVGCHQPPPPPLQLHPVEGKVFVHGRPAQNVSVVFHPVNSTAPTPRYPVGVTGPDGVFHLTTLSAYDGAPEGEYIVTVLWLDETIPFDCCENPDPTTHDRLRGQYLDPATTTLRATVRPGPNAITLHADPGARGWNLPRATPPSDGRDRTGDRR
jgi:hypothetical protein